MLCIILNCEFNCCPALADFGLRLLEANGLQRVYDLVHTLLDDTRNNEDTAFFKVAQEAFLHGDEYVRNDICCDYVILVVYLIGKLLVGEDIAEVGLVNIG